MKKMDFGSKVRKYLKKGKKGKFNRFYKEVINLYENQIDVLEKENEDISGEFGKLAKIKEDKLNFIFDIDPMRISDVNQRQEYAMEYASELLEFDVNKIQPLKEKLEDNKKQIQILKDAIKFLDTAEPDIDEEEEENDE
jgi:hypothetical protein